MDGRWRWWTAVASGFCGCFLSFFVFAVPSVPGRALVQRADQLHLLITTIIVCSVLFCARG